MYLGVDIGGTKTFVAVFSDSAEIIEQTKFPTPTEYPDFLEEIANTVAKFTTKEFIAAGIGIPGLLNRQQGLVIGLGNLAWKDIPIQADVAAIVHCPVVIENDANLAGLSEAQLHKDAAKVLYFTISTGIGTAVVYNQALEPALLDSEGGHIMLPYQGKIVDWETFGSGKAIFAKFGKKAAEITDSTDWQAIVDNWVLGFHANMAIIQPDLIIIGGSIGTYFNRYGEMLRASLQNYLEVLVPTPPIVQAQRPEEAVVYGCYDLAKQRFGHA